MSLPILIFISKNRKELVVIFIVDAMAVVAVATVTFVATIPV